MSFFEDRLNVLKSAYALYLQGLNRQEIERLLKHDTTELYAYYTKGLHQYSKEELKKPQLLVRFVKDIFISFVEKLSPARRAFYMVSLILFGWGLVTAQIWYGVVGFLVLNLLLALELADKLRAKSELEFAREIQLSLLPQMPPQIGNLHSLAFTETAMEVGGDYYDWFQLEDGRLLFIVGDVSGKGITAALYMVKFQGFVQMLVKENLSLKEILFQLNELCRAHLKRNFFITAATAMYSPLTGEMTICRAGHNPIIYFQQNEQQCYRIEPKGLALGLENNNLFDTILQEVKIQIKSGDLVFLYTDGLNETHNNLMEQFGERKIEKIIARYASETPEHLKAIILNQVFHFRAQTPIHDDLTFLIIKAE